MAGVYDFIRSPLPVSERTINIVPCPMLTTAACNRDPQRARPRYVHVTDDTRTYGDAFEAVNA